MDSSNQDPILGYDKEGNAIIQPKGRVYTQSFVICFDCGHIISSHGGPRFGSLCVPCFVKKLAKESHE